MTSKVVSSTLDGYNKQRHSRSNKGILYYNTVQTSWRPQLPLPKDITNDVLETNSKTTSMRDTSSDMDKSCSNKKDYSLKNTSNNKKWSFGRLFRKKKESVIDTNSSSDEDRKAGFTVTSSSTPQKFSRKKDKKRNGIKITNGNGCTAAGFDHIVISPKENEIFLPLGHFESTTASSDHTRSTNSLDRRMRRERKRAALLAQTHSSSEDEIKSHNSYNSSSISRYRSDDSVCSGGIINGNNRKSRSARNERYYKRYFKDDYIENNNTSPQMLQVSQQVGRWKTQPIHHVEVHNQQINDDVESFKPTYGLRNSASLSSVPISSQRSTIYIKQPSSSWENQSIQSYQNSIQSLGVDKRIYDDQMHFQNEKSKTPPPPPPRDPQRRLNVHQSETRPISYAFDKTYIPQYTMNGRCVSDDRLWGDPNGNIYQTLSFQRPSSTQPIFTQHQQRRFITRNNGNPETISQNGQEYKYMADGLPRSRKPIHILQDEVTPSSQISNNCNQSQSSSFQSPPIIRTTKSGLPATSMQSASDFWKKLEKENSCRGRSVEVSGGPKSKQRSASSSRIEEPRSYHNPMLENLYANQDMFKPKEEKYWVMGQRHNHIRNKSDPFNKYQTVNINKSPNEKKYSIQDYADEVDKMDLKNSFNWQDFNQSSSLLNNRRNEIDWLKKPNVEGDRQKLESTKKLTKDFENVVNGSLFIKPVKDKNIVEICNKSDFNKSRSLPNHYNKRNTISMKNYSPILDTQEKNAKTNINTLNALDHNRNVLSSLNKSIHDDRDDNISEISHKSTNLEDAINELEAIYNSLKLGDEDLLDRAERRDIPTPTDFGKYAKISNDEYADDDDEEQVGEPDVVLDDVVYRNIKHSNSILKVVEPQPPFGIPIGPIPPSPKTSYLHVTPEKDTKKNRCLPHNNVPDVICDDLAVRSLRKDPPGSERQSKFVYPSGSLKKKRATRSQSANIYTLIQRDAAKPSGGSLYDYFDLDKNIEKSESMSDVRKETDDIPSTLYLLRSLRDEEKKSTKPKQAIFRHPSQGGAVYNLPIVLSDKSSIIHKPPVPLPRKNLSPAPSSDMSRGSMEAFLNQIAKEAKESSRKLTKDLEALRKEALLKSSNDEHDKSQLLHPNFEKDIEDIEETSKAVKHFEKILCDVVPPQMEAEFKPKELSAQRKLEKEMNLLNEISNFSDVAKLCNKKLEDIVVTKHPPIVQTAQTIHQETSSEIDTVNKIKKDVKEKNYDDSLEKYGKAIINPNNEKESTVTSLLGKIDPNSGKINEIAERCMRQISELSDLTDDQSTSSGPDYDNLKSSSKICKTNDEIPSVVEDINIQNTTCIVPGQQIGHCRQSTNRGNDEDDIDKIIKECEYQAKKSFDCSRLANISSDKKCFSSLLEENRTSDGSASGSVGGGGSGSGLIFSSSDCLKSTSPSLLLHHQPSSSAISSSTHGFSSGSDYMKSSASSSDANLINSDSIKTSSTTSYDVKSSSTTPNKQNKRTSVSPSSTSPSPPLNLTPITLIGNSCNNNIKNINANIDKTASSSSINGSNNNISDYNSSDELAMIFGIDKNHSSTSPFVASSTTTTAKQTGNTLKIDDAHACDDHNNSFNNCCYTRNANNTTITAIIKDHANLPTNKNNFNNDCCSTSTIIKDDDLKLLSITNNVNECCYNNYDCISNSSKSLRKHDEDVVHENDNLSLSVARNSNNNNNSNINNCNPSSLLLPLTEINITDTNIMTCTDSTLTSTAIPSLVHKNNNNLNQVTTPSDTSSNALSSSCHLIDAISKFNDNDNDNDDVVVNKVFSNNKKCMSNENNENFYNYSNNIQILFTNDNETDDDDDVSTTNQCNNTITTSQTSMNHLDSLSSLDESNPDSGNVSLNEFPLKCFSSLSNSASSSSITHSTIINTSFVELSLLHNSCRLEIPSISNNDDDNDANNVIQNSFINQIEIEPLIATTVSTATTATTTSTTTATCYPNFSSYTSVTCNSTSVSHLDVINNDDDDDDDNNDDNSGVINQIMNKSIPTNLSGDNDVLLVHNILNDNENTDDKCNDGDLVHNSSHVNIAMNQNANYNELKQRLLSQQCDADTFSSRDTSTLNQCLSSQSQQLQREQPSTSSSSDFNFRNNNNSSTKILLDIRNNSQQTILGHALIACTTYSLINSDFYTYLILILAFILLIAFILW